MWFSAKAMEQREFKKKGTITNLSRRENANMPSIFYEFLLGEQS
jgi:hypothetical protein